MIWIEDWRISLCLFVIVIESASAAGQDGGRSSQDCYVKEHCRHWIHHHRWGEFFSIFTALDCDTVFHSHDPLMLSHNIYRITLHIYSLKIDFILGCRLLSALSGSEGAGPHWPIAGGEPRMVHGVAWRENTMKGSVREGEWGNWWVLFVRRILSRHVCDRSGWSVTGVYHRGANGKKEKLRREKVN